jgi:Aspartyl/Asparaginyl beta-hydroxylase
MKHFELIGGVDVAPAISLLPAIEHLWTIHTLRQTAVGSPHRDTECIYVRMPADVDADKIFTAMDIDYYLNSAEIDQIISEVARLTKERPARVMLVKLKARGVITPHIDKGPYAEATNRYHVALITSPHCVMHIGEESVSGGVGEIWRFDKHAVHCVFNDSEIDRVHLIVDCWRRSP